MVWEISALTVPTKPDMAITAKGAIAQYDCVGSRSTKDKKGAKGNRQMGANE